MGGIGSDVNWMLEKFVNGKEFGPGGGRLWVT